MVLFSVTIHTKTTSGSLTSELDLSVVSEHSSAAARKVPPVLQVFMGGELANKVESRHERVVRGVRDVYTTKLIQHIMKICFGQRLVTHAGIRQVFYNMPVNAKNSFTAYMWAAGIGLTTCHHNIISVTERQQNYQKMALEYDIPMSDIADEMDWAFVVQMLEPDISAPKMLTSDPPAALLTGEADVREPFAQFALCLFLKKNVLQIKVNSLDVRRVTYGTLTFAGIGNSTEHRDAMHSNLKPRVLARSAHVISELGIEHGFVIRECGVGAKGAENGNLEHELLPWLYCPAAESKPS
ncbi:hypothetical protein HJFPF1_08409 [Paramyrothecium foliicola]|nr:hypothetical protein HJFPF1_08409 [Paramyrothecium foliicola]